VVQGTKESNIKERERNSRKAGKTNTTKPQGKIMKGVYNEIYCYGCNYYNGYAKLWYV
jgi:hypothetical protein